MDDLPATAVPPGDPPAELAQTIRHLQAELAQLRQEVSGLKQQNTELAMQANYWRAQHGRARKLIDGLQAQVQESQAENRRLRQEVFGRRSERVPSGEFGSNWLRELDAERNVSRRRGRQAGQPAPRRRTYQHLPIRDEVIELPPGQRCCPHCGQAYVERPETEDAEQIEIEVHAYRRVLRRRRYQPQCRCTGPWRVVTAPAPAKLLPKSRYGASVWVEILLDKFASQRPTGRLLEQWRLAGLDLAKGTVTEGLQRLEPLFTPLYQALVQHQQKGRYWQGDETRWQVFAEQEGKRSQRWWLWVFIGTDCVVFRLDPSRSRRVPQSHLPERPGQVGSGVMLVDRFASYKAMKQVQQGEIILVYCWAHVRRDFIRLGRSWPQLRNWALEWIQQIRELYRVHEQRWLAHPQDPDSAVTAGAAQKVRQHVDSMRRQMLTQAKDKTLQRPCRKVLTNLEEHWAGLTRFVDDPSIPLDNNACERQLRGPVLGRKNYYGSGAIWSGRLAAMLFSLLGTMQRCGVNPRRWLTDYLQACATAGGRPPPDIDKWLPWRHTPESSPASASPHVGLIAD